MRIRTKIFQGLARLAGLEGDKTSRREKLISGIGGFLAILLMFYVSTRFVGADTASLVVFSMGASAVLLFAVPHGALSQPWAVVGGQTVSAVVGVTSYLVIPDPFLAAAVAVGLSIIAMYHLRCIHPPGGATALAAVAGPDVHALGYTFVVTPVLLNVVVLLVVAVLFNYAFPWRRYPVAFAKGRPHSPAKKAPVAENFPAVKPRRMQAPKRSAALKIEGGTGTIVLDPLPKLHCLASGQIKIGACYSNGAEGADRVVCQIVGADREALPEGDGEVVYRIVFGPEEGRMGVLPSQEFARWAKREVAFHDIAGERVAANAQWNKGIVSIGWEQ